MRELANPAPVQLLSANDGTGLNDWVDWLREEVTAHRERCERRENTLPAVQPEGANFHAREGATD